MKSGLTEEPVLDTVADKRKLTAAVPECEQDICWVSPTYHFQQVGRRAALLSQGLLQQGLPFLVLLTDTWGESYTHTCYSLLTYSNNLTNRWTQNTKFSYRPLHHHSIVFWQHNTLCSLTTAEPVHPQFNCTQRMSEEKLYHVHWAQHEDGRHATLPVPLCGLGVQREDRESPSGALIVLPCWRLQPSGWRSAVMISHQKSARRSSW